MSTSVTLRPKAALHSFESVQREEKSLSPSEVSDFLRGKIPNSHPKDNGCSADVHTVLRVVFTQLSSVNHMGICDLQGHSEEQAGRRHAFAIMS